MASGYCPSSLQVVVTSAWLHRCISPRSNTNPARTPSPSRRPIRLTMNPQSSPMLPVNHRYHHGACQVRGPHEWSRSPAPFMSWRTPSTVMCPVADTSCSVCPLANSSPGRSMRSVGSPPNMGLTARSVMRAVTSAVGDSVKALRGSSSAMGLSRMMTWPSKLMLRCSNGSITSNDKPADENSLAVTLGRAKVKPTVPSGSHRHTVTSPRPSFGRLPSRKKAPMPVTGSKQLL